MAPEFPTMEPENVVNVCGTGNLSNRITTDVSKMGRPSSCPQAAEAQAVVGDHMTTVWHKNPNMPGEFDADENEGVADTSRAGRESKAAAAGMRSPLTTSSGIRLANAATDNHCLSSC
jgi:hypothetical protein